MRLRGDLAGFFRELRSGLGEGRLPYVWVPQWHPGGHGLHAHFAVGRFVPRKLIEGAWGNGFVHIKLLDGLPVGSGALGEARLAARAAGVQRPALEGAPECALHQASIAIGGTRDRIGTQNRPFERLRKAYTSPNPCWSYAQRRQLGA